MPEAPIVHNETVSSGTEDIRDDVIPNGVTWLIESWVGSADPQRDTEVCIVWDRGGAGEEKVVLTHGSTVSPVGREFVGDGVKKMSICLINNSNDSADLGVQYFIRKP